MSFINHLSVRVPWHDDQWRGTVCKKPRENAACVALPEITAKKMDDAEECVAGRRFDELTESELPPCVRERVSFMAPFTLRRDFVHPYKGSGSAEHRDLKAMTQQQPAFSATCIPFKWMRREHADKLSASWHLDFDPAREPTEPEWLVNSGWVQNGRNQRALLDGFFSAIKPDDSLCFVYAKQTPFSDDARRVIVGVGRVKRVGRPLQYEREGRTADADTSYVWDVTIEHSIRPSDGDGFLLPYAELAAAQERGAVIDWDRCLAFSPEGQSAEFSYAAEHVSHDGAIAALLECKLALEAARAVLVDGEAIPKALRWIDSRISELWNLRGAYPGLGAALTALGAQHGNFLALHLAEQLGDNEDPWPLVDKVMRNPISLPPTLRAIVTRDLTDIWKKLKPKRLELLKLLARFALTNEQADRFFVSAVRTASGLDYVDDQLLENPYVIYEGDRFAYPASDEHTLERVRLETIDRGAYPAEAVALKHPLPEPSCMSGALDKRRVRAQVIGQLEHAAEADGHTMLPEEMVILGIRSAKLEPPCPVSEDVIEAVAEFLPYEVFRVALKGGRPALQLQRYLASKKMLSKEIHNRALLGKRFEHQNDWRARLDSLLPPIDEADKDEVRAREEKAAALAELAASRFSILIGPAGAGKTTVLKALCKHEEIAKKGVLLLAPTGKARVQLSQKSGHDASTLAQFLLACGGRFDSRTGAYKTVAGAPYVGCKTVIVDEASMLTEDMLSALFDAIKGTVERIILVGDPRQLPPIGAGKPFFDAVTYLTPKTGVQFPRVGKGYAELTIQRRHKASGEADSFPLDLQLANWFSGRPLAPGEDEVWSILGGQGDTTGRVMTHRWDSVEELRKAMLECLCTELDLKGIDDQHGFAQSYGGVPKNGYIRFEVGAASRVDDWQVLTPLRHDVFGAREINRLLHRTFRKDAISWANSGRRNGPRTTPPRGMEEIVYGDKVINVRNHKRKFVNPAEGALQYIANGEIGVVEGEVAAVGSSTDPWRTKVEFSSQQGFVYNFGKSDFDADRGPSLELAFAVTVHKAQGSEFETTILVLPKKSRLISREMLYTALTRQKRRVVILHQGDLADLQQLATDDNAVIPARFTNLFEKEAPELLPAPVQVNGKWLDEKLIHRSRRGTLLRSKSEVIIDDALAAHDIDASYEVRFYGTDGKGYRLPDFTIEDQSLGRTILWEHCGMLADASYAERWEKKLKWYRQNGVELLSNGGGDKASLVVTYDDERGGIDGKAIHELIKEIFD
jgi:hypothetical protein